MSSTTFDFEKPIVDLQLQIEKVKQVAEKTKVDMSATLAELELKIDAARHQIYSNLSGWQNVQISRHPERPYTLSYIEMICDDFIEMHGDRTVRDDKAIVGGFASIGGQTVMIIGHQKGVNTKMRQYRNFGMANPEGYRKALRLMKLAEKFNKPVITFIDTPGAYPGLEAEERGQDRGPRTEIDHAAHDLTQRLARANATVGRQSSCSGAQAKSTMYIAARL